MNLITFTGESKKVKMKNENLLWIDSLRVLATLGVISAHVIAPILYQNVTVINFDWWIGNIYDGSGRFCVPIFLMISGALILSKTYSIGEYLKKRISRILFPFLFWSIIYIAKDILLKFYHGEYVSIIELLKFVFLQLKSGASCHLWYIYMIIGLYLFFPIIGKWINKSNKREIEYFIVIWLITIFAGLPFVEKTIPNINITYFSGYIGFPVLGYYLSQKITFNFERKKITCIALILTGSLITILGTFFITKYKGKFYDGFYHCLSPNIILVSVGIFLLFKNSVNLGTRVSSIILFFSKYSYGIYLSHMLVLWGFSLFDFPYSFLNPIIGIPITSILCFFISTLITWKINKLPLGKYISG